LSTLYGGMGSALFYGHHVYFANFRNPFYLSNSIFSEAFWYPSGDDFRHGRMDIALWIVCLRQSYGWLMDDYCVMSGIWNDFRLFRYLRFSFCGNLDRFAYTIIGTRLVYDDDKW